MNKDELEADVRAEGSRAERSPRALPHLTARPLRCEPQLDRDLDEYSICRAQRFQAWTTIFTQLGADSELQFTSDGSLEQIGNDLRQVLRNPVAPFLGQGVQPAPAS